MGRTIREFQDGSILEYDRGQFDEWCVFLTRPNQPKYAPRDVQYFTQIRTLAGLFTGKKIYSDFVSVYEMTTKKLENQVLDQIHFLSNVYGDHQLEIEILFTIIYSGMIAEENKQYTRLGKRVKRLGLHQVLIENVEPGEAANYSKNKPWREIASQCEKRGF